ncbi:hypothetical protein ADUPG1_004542, partial [Aduncisulcus paluster]
MFSVMLPYAFIQSFGITEAQFGSFSSFIFIGMLIGPVFATMWSKKSNTESIVFISMLVTSALMFGMGLLMSAYMPAYFQTPMGILA